jgi:thiol:disulfide interchange protein DsbC
MKIFKHLFLLFGLSAVANAAMSNEDFTKLNAFKEVNATINGSKLIGKNLDLYLVQGIDAKGRNFSIVTDKDGKYLILTSNVFDTKNKTAVTIPADVSFLKGQELFSFGKGKKEYFVFTDPECPYCRKFEAKWDSIEKDVKFNVFFFNLSFHKKADAMGRWILAAKTNEEKMARLKAIGAGSLEFEQFKPTPEQKKKLDAMMAKTKELGQKLGVQGTPAIFDTKGNKINWPDLIK